MRTFYIRRDYYDKKDYVFRKAHIDIQPGLTVLIGCNGCGKTTFLQHLKRQLEDEKAKVVWFNNVTDGGSHGMSKAMLLGDMGFVARAAVSSEGEKIRQNIEQVAVDCGRACRSIKDEDEREVWILLDAIDSGLSVDQVVDIKEQLFNTIIEDCESKGIKPYIVVSANEYEMARGENCLDIQSGKYVKIRSYDGYRYVIMRTRKYKDKRYE